jgi:hypothetical protein
MFLTTNKTKIVEMSREQGYDASWDKNDDLLLQHIAVISRNHTRTGEEFWCTHFNVLQASTFAVPWAWDAQIFQSKKSALTALFIHLYLSLRWSLGYHPGSNTRFADDGSDFSWDEAMAIRRVIARHTWMFPYERGDVLALDNHRIAHGRTPWFEGKRSVLVAYK